MTLEQAGKAHCQGTCTDEPSSPSLPHIFSCKPDYWTAGSLLESRPGSVLESRPGSVLESAKVYPEIADPSAREDPLPSCSAAEALERQEPFINHTLAASALAMVARLFRYGRISYHGAFFNAESGRMSGLAVDPARWKRSRSRRYTRDWVMMKRI